MGPKDAIGWTIQCDGSAAFVSNRRGVVLDWRVPDGSGERDTVVPLLDGYRTLEERMSYDGSRQSILAPWSNRIRDGRYTWDGEEYDLGPDPSGRREGLHGLVEITGFEMKEQNDHRLKLCKTLQDDGYPQPLRVCLTYELGHDVDRDGRDTWSLTHTTRCTNWGDSSAPVGLGWNPHILWHGDREGATIDMPAGTVVRTTDDLIPLPGDTAFDQTGLARQVIAQPSDLEQTWTDLDVDDDGRVRMRINHASGAETVLDATTIGGGSGIDVIHLSTGENQRFRPGNALACEYSQFMPNAFNRDELRDALTLEPGQTRELQTSIVHRF